jgi:hypothetical protein
MLPALQDIIQYYVTSITRHNTVLCYQLTRHNTLKTNILPDLIQFLVVTRLTRRVPLVEREPLTLPEHLRSPPVFSGVRVTRSLVLCVCFVNRCLFFCTPSVLLRYTDSDYPFGIFNLFLKINI